MAILAKGTKDYKRVPVGIHPAVCIDVIDKGVELSPFKDDRTGADKMVHKIRIVWQLHIVDEESGEIVLRDDGAPFRVGRDYTLSLNQKANLRKDLENWRGKVFTDEDLAKGFDVEVLIGVQCQLNMQDVKKGEKVYSNVVGILPKHKADPKIVLHGFPRELEIPGGKDMRSPAETIGGGNMAKQVDATDPFEEDEEELDDLPF